MNDGTSRRTTTIVDPMQRKMIKSKTPRKSKNQIPMYVSRAFKFFNFFTKDSPILIDGIQKSAVVCAFWEIVLRGRRFLPLIHAMNSIQGMPIYMVS